MSSLPVCVYYMYGLIDWCAPSYSLNGWTDLIHIQEFSHPRSLAGESEHSSSKKIRALQMCHKTVAIFSATAITIFHKILVIYGNHLRKWKRICGIFRKVMVHALGAQTRMPVFSKPALTVTQTSLLFGIRQPPVGYRARICFVSKVRKSTSIVYEKVYAVCLHRFFPHNFGKVPSLNYYTHSWIIRRLFLSTFPFTWREEWRWMKRIKRGMIGALPKRLLLNNGPGAASAALWPSCLPAHQYRKILVSGWATFTCLC
jgi:hypothetical protein